MPHLRECFCVVVVWFLNWRCLIDALLKGVHNIHQFKKVLEMFYSEREFYEVAESMKVVYCVLKNEEKIMKTLNFNNLFMCLRKQNFFTNHEEATLLKKKKEIQEIIEILKDKDMHSFKIFLSCLKELKQDLVTTVISSSDKYLTPLLDKFKQFLQKRYINGSFTQISEVDFKLPISDDINIALIEISEEDHKKESTFFDYYSLLLKQEAGYSRQFLDSYSDIIVDNCKVILIQGYPGSGKTFLAKTMCKKWARGELLQTFSFVIFLQLRDIEVANAKTLDELIELYMGSLTKTIMDEIYERNGQDSLIILEGWDELPECKQHSCLFTRLISGDLLPEAVIVITSRPSAIRSLQYNCIKRRIEILGFTEQQVGQNITCYFQKYTNASELIQKFYSELKRLPLLESSVFVPINLCIALYIFNKSSYHLPETFTDMYKNLVLIQLRRYQARRSHGSASINTLEDLPKDIEDMLLRLSKMAYDYLQKDLTLIFNETKIRQYCFYSRDVSLDSFDGMGLLQITNHRHFESVNKTYEFIHRTLQELLAAWYLSRQNEVFQQKQVQNIFNRKDFEMVWIFYAGLTKFKTVSFKEILPRNSVLKIKMSSYKAFTWLMWTVVSNTFTRFHDICKIIDVFFGGKQYSHNLSHYISREFQTTLIAAVMEAQNPQLCKEMCESYLFYGDTCWFCVPQSAATPQILSALSYCIAHSGKKWMIHSIGLDCSDADNLLKYLTCNETFHCKCNKCNNFSGNADNGICVFDLNSSQSKVDGIVKLITTQKCLQW
ncbi:uncharacterized protein [Dysidea avara]|uniref:uncharacterized protein isoform X2 n=1 Tax=Dysidea avara TaxID=196820 RepID=UPI00332E64FC